MKQFLIYDKDMYEFLCKVNAEDENEAIQKYLKYGSIPLDFHEYIHNICDGGFCFSFGYKENQDDLDDKELEIQFDKLFKINCVKYFKDKPEYAQILINTWNHSLDSYCLSEKLPDELIRFVFIKEHQPGRNYCPLNALELDTIPILE